MKSKAQFQQLVTDFAINQASDELTARVYELAFDAAMKQMEAEPRFMSQVAKAALEAATDEGVDIEGETLAEYSEGLAEYVIANAPDAIRVCLSAHGEVEINGVDIEQSVFDDEKIDWKLVSLEELIDDLYTWIGEASGSNRTLMIQDVQMLSKLDDEHVWSCISTNDYVAYSTRPLLFNEICETAIETNNLITRG
jgi:hypothetical protein